MAMGKRRRSVQQKMWVETVALPKTPGHPFYERLSKLLEQHGFDAFAEETCASFYTDKIGRPSLDPGIYFRLMTIGYFESSSEEDFLGFRAMAQVTGLLRGSG